MNAPSEVVIGQAVGHVFGIVIPAIVLTAIIYGFLRFIGYRLKRSEQIIAFAFVSRWLPTSIISQNCTNKMNPQNLRDDIKNIKVHLGIVQKDALTDKQQGALGLANEVLDKIYLAAERECTSGAKSYQLRIALKEIATCGQAGS